MVSTKWLNFVLRAAERCQFGYSPSDQRVYQYGDDRADLERKLAVRRLIVEYAVKRRCEQSAEGINKADERVGVVGSQQQENKAD